MPFLTDDDYSAQTRAEVMQVVNVNPSLSRPTAEGMAQEQMTAYLRPRGIDITATFTAVGANRNPMIIMYMIDLVMYILHSNTAGRVMPKVRQDRFDAAIGFLEKVNSGELDPSLPKIDAISTDPIYRFGSDAIQRQRW